MLSRIPVNAKKQKLQKNSEPQERTHTHVDQWSQLFMTLYIAFLIF